jgi:hypothetical protein
MPTLSDLWRVRGSIPVPNQADDAGLMSRVADILEQAGVTVTEEDRNLVRFHVRSLPVRNRRFASLTALERGEVRRDGIGGLRVLRYDWLMLSPVLESLFANAALTTGLSWLLSDFHWPSGVAAHLVLILPTVAFVGGLFYVRAGRGKQVRADLRRAFET